MLCLVAIASCSSPDGSAFEIDLTTVYNQVNFEKPVVGQVSKYVLFRGFNFGDVSSSIDYTGDTLEVTLIAKSGKNYSFQEHITIGSSVYNGADPYIEGHDMLKTSEWQVVGDSLILAGGSTFLLWPGRKSLPFVLSSGAATHTMREWGTSSNPFEASFNINDAMLNDFNFEDLIGGYDALDIPVDGDGYEILYNKPFGIIRSSRFEPETLSGFGWDLKLGR